MPHWQAGTFYKAGTVVAHTAYYRASIDHVSGPESPAENRHLWTPVKLYFTPMVPQLPKSSTWTFWPYVPTTGFWPWVGPFFFQHHAPVSLPGPPTPPIHVPIPRNPIHPEPAYSEPPNPPLLAAQETHYQTLKLRELVNNTDCDEEKLVSEVMGERVIPVHGCGVWAYSGHRSSHEEELKQEAWKQHGTRESWLASARARTELYARPGVVKPPLRWVLVEKGLPFPPEALQTGTEASGLKLYSVRTWWEGGVHLGKAGEHLHHGASISYGSSEHSVDIYEVLVGDSSFARWVTVPPGTTLGPSLDEFGTPFQPVEGGREANGSFLAIAQAEYDGGWHPGKAAMADDHCCIGFGSGEVWVRDFQILAYTV